MTDLRDSKNGLVRFHAVQFCLVEVRLGYVTAVLKIFEHLSWEQCLSLKTKGSQLMISGVIKDLNIRLISLSGCWIR